MRAWARTTATSGNWFSPDVSLPAQPPTLAWLHSSAHFSLGCSDTGRYSFVAGQPSCTNCPPGYLFPFRLHALVAFPVLIWFAVVQAIWSHARADQLHSAYGPIARLLRHASHTAFACRAKGSVRSLILPLFVVRRVSVLQSARLATTALLGAPPHRQCVSDALAHSPATGPDTLPPEFSLSPTASFLALVIDHLCSQRARPTARVWQARAARQGARCNPCFFVGFGCTIEIC